MISLKNIKWGFLTFEKRNSEKISKIGNWKIKNWKMKKCKMKKMKNEMISTEVIRKTRDCLDKFAINFINHWMQPMFSKTWQKKLRRLGDTSSLSLSLSGCANKNSVKLSELLTVSWIFRGDWKCNDKIKWQLKRKSWGGIIDELATCCRQQHRLAHTCIAIYWDQVVLNCLNICDRCDFWMLSVLKTGIRAPCFGLRETAVRVGKNGSISISISSKVHFYFHRPELM